MKKFFSNNNMVDSQSVNPLLPLDEYIPDVEARVFKNREGEERLYLYGSHDNFGSKTWCSYRYYVYSSPTSDLKNWSCHGVSFASRKSEGYVWKNKNADGIKWNNERLYAPDVNKIGNKYYLITCSAEGGCLGVAIAENPEGPFSPAQKIVFDDGEETSSIDPALYVEETNGQIKVYLFWGQRPSFNGKGLLGAELQKDKNGIYRILKKETLKVLFTGENDEFGFYEGASIRKIMDKYYILYPSDKGRGVHVMSYAVSDSPLGKYEYRGNILENDGCDLRSGNNHGSFCKVNGQWYLFYHRGSNNSDTQRRVCVEKIYFNENGNISGENGGEVPMTNHGFGKSLCPYQKIEAAYATHVRIAGFKNGCYLTEKNKQLHPLINITDGNCVEYRDFDFNTGGLLEFSATILPKNGGKIEIVVDSPNAEAAGTLHIPKKIFGRYSEFKTNIKSLSGTHTVYLRFKGNKNKKICELAHFKFKKLKNK